MNTDLLELYSDYLLSAFSYTTATGLSAMTGGAVSHDKITRFLSEKELDSRALWRLVKPLARELEGEEGVLIIDDTLSRRSPTLTKASSFAGTTITAKGETSKV
jgi:hypothetical protein